MRQLLTFIPENGIRPSNKWFNRNAPPLSQAVLLNRFRISQELIQNTANPSEPDLDLDVYK